MTKNANRAKSALHVKNVLPANLVKSVLSAKKPRWLPRHLAKSAHRAHLVKSVHHAHRVKTASLAANAKNAYVNCANLWMQHLLLPLPPQP